MGTQMRSPQGEQATVSDAGLAAMRALGWTEQGSKRSNTSSGSQAETNSEAPKRRPGRPRKSETAAEAPARDTAGAEPAEQGDG